MAARYELEARITSATDLKNVNWRLGQLKPYAVVYVEGKEETRSCATYACADVDDNDNASYSWDQKLLIPFRTPILESTFRIDVIHDHDGLCRDPLIGSAQFALIRIDLGRRGRCKLCLKRPSGRPQGKVEMEFSLRPLEIP